MGGGGVNARGRVRKCTWNLDENENEGIRPALLSGERKNPAARRVWWCITLLA